MKYRRGVGLLFVMGLAAVLAWPGSVKAAHIYGGWDSNHVLVPYFQVDLNNSALTHRNVLLTVANLDTNTPNTFPVTGAPVAADFHVRLFSVDSIEACDICLPETPRDVESNSITSIIAGTCSSAGRALLDPTNSGIFRGYAVVELFQPTTNCTLAGQERDNDFGMAGSIYYVQLALGQATGINAPGYFDLSDNGGLNVFNLVSQERLLFRFLVSLGGDPNRAQTQAIVWSATSGACHESGEVFQTGGAVPDSECLNGVGPGSTFLVCDENELCTSQPLPELNHEVNIFLVDSIIPASFNTGGGYFQLINDPARSGGNTLSVLGYADNQAIGTNAALNWEAVFPAQREVSQ